MIHVLHFDDKIEHHKLTKAMVGRLRDDITLDHVDSLPKAKEMLESGKYSCVVTDRQIPDDGGIRLLKTARDGGKELPFIFLLDEGVELESGSFSHVYSERFAHYEDLAGKIEEIAGNNIEQSADIDPATTAKIESLTVRETEILSHLAMGHSNKVIAQILDISYKTVLNHVNNLYQKLGVNNRLEAAHLAIRAKLVKIE